MPFGGALFGLDAVSDHQLAHRATQIQIDVTDVAPQNPVERLIYRLLIWTWPLYALGALYVIGPVLGWVLGGFAVLALYLGPAMRADLRPQGPLPIAIWVWIMGMAAMLIILWIGHVNWNFGIGPTIRSTIGWAKGWALMALFPLAGSVFPVRRAILIRGQCIVGLGVLIVTPFMLLAPVAGLPEFLFASPLKVVGGPGPEYFSVFLYTIDPSNGAVRLQYFAPWSPFAALIGVLMVCFALEELDMRWKTVGVLAGMTMVVAAKSRMGLVGLVICPTLPRLLHLSRTPLAWMGLSASFVVVALLIDKVLKSLGVAIQTFNNARADSTRVRATLQRIATERWHEEAPWFGHGRVAPGGHIVEFMPIGSHHTWFGLLFVKGIAGFVVLAIPFIYQTFLALRDTVYSRRGILPLSIVLVFLLLSFGENIEIEVYLLWPALLLLGIHAREVQKPN